MLCNNILSVLYNTIQYNTIQYNTIQYYTIQYNTIQYNTIQYNTIQYNTIQHNPPSSFNHFPLLSSSLIYTIILSSIYYSEFFVFNMLLASIRVFLFISFLSFSPDIPLISFLSSPLIYLTSTNFPSSSVILHYHRTLSLLPHLFLFQI